MRIRTYLFLMAAGILVPVVVFAGLALGMLQNAEREAALRGLKETSNSIALLVDRELYSAEAGLRVLGGSPSLAQGDLKGFYAQARRANRGSTGWTVLLDEHGQQLINTIRPYGSALPSHTAPALVKHVIATQKTYVSDVIPGPVVKGLVTTVNVPVPIDEGKRYVLSVAFSTDHFTRLIASVDMPPGWLVGIIDSQGRFIARNHNPEGLIGKPARPELVAAARQAHSGQIRHNTVEGTEAYDVFTHSTLSGWTLAVAAPVELIERSARHAAFVAGMGLLAAMLCAAALAAYFGRQHVRSIARAVKAATDLGAGQAPRRVHSRVDEMNELHDALHAAGEQMLQAQAYRRNAEIERQALLDAEKTARQMAEQQNSAKDQFLAMLGHELRNPLAPISTAAQLLRLQPDDAKRVRYASDVISRQVEHINSLLGDMLDVSRVTRGLVTLNMEEIELDAILDRALEQTHSLVESAHHRVELALPPTPIRMRGDRTRLTQIFANLLNNAAKYTPPNGRIGIDAKVDDGHVVVTVSDTGEGLAPELAPRVFDLFSQGERKPDRAQGGLGLGLALVQSLVQLHGGSITASSPGPGLGSSFTVTLPCEPRDSAPLPAPRRRRGDARGPALRVMIVDDNVDGAISLSLFLEAAGGHNVCTYYDASAALARAASEAPDVFILDIGLPDITGYELARQLRAMAQFRDALFIALTGYGQPQDREQAREAGFDHHLAKPADPQHVLELLSRPRKAEARRAASVRS
ncbi:hybrid sensor histidine kinase/response regulator [Massilia violaceinigra]|uniref:histidine kinase n=1 Tax=Massilia violaceinigra TaxID=2045208 RepID=A0A2D2DQ37_9BURK|nr:ATP-binding protein [Massilia violaceinigra]ATQ77053.1 hybrid sensor histidine kinase/response regulator [Massilia violaceinigra]